MTRNSDVASFCYQNFVEYTCISCELVYFLANCVLSNKILSVSGGGRGGMGGRVGGVVSGC